MMLDTLLNKGQVIANEVEWWEVRAATNEATGKISVLMYFKTLDGEERTYVLHNEAPSKFLAALGSCVNAMNEQAPDSAPPENKKSIQ